MLVSFPGRYARGSYDKDKWGWRASAIESAVNLFSSLETQELTRSVAPIVCNNADYETILKEIGVALPGFQRR